MDSSIFKDVFKDFTVFDVLIDAYGDIASHLIFKYGEKLTTISRHLELLITEDDKTRFIKKEYETNYNELNEMAYPFLMQILDGKIKHLFDKEKNFFKYIDMAQPVFKATPVFAPLNTPVSYDSRQFETAYTRFAQNTRLLKLLVVALDIYQGEMLEQDKTVLTNALFFYKTAAPQNMQHIFDNIELLENRFTYYCLDIYYKRAYIKHLVDILKIPTIDYKRKYESVNEVLNVVMFNHNQQILDIRTEYEQQILELQTALANEKLNKIVWKGAQVDLIRLLWSLNTAKFFKTKEGFAPTDKAVIEYFSNVLDCDMSDYNQKLTNAFKDGWGNNTKMIEKLLNIIKNRLNDKK